MMIPTNLNKQQALHANPKSIQQINFLEIQNNKQQYFSLLKKQKKLFQILLVILMMRINFHINCYQFMHKFQGFVKLLQSLTAAASATDTAICAKMFGSGNTTLKIFKIEMNDIMKIIKSIEKSGLLTKAVSKKWSKRRITRNVMRHFRCQFIKKSINR